MTLNSDNQHVKDWKHEEKYEQRDFETVNGGVTLLVPTNPVLRTALTKQPSLVVVVLAASKRRMALLRALARASREYLLKPGAKEI